MTGRPTRSPRRVRRWPASFRPRIPTATQVSQGAGSAVSGQHRRRRSCRCTRRSSWPLPSRRRRARPTLGPARSTGCSARRAARRVRRRPRIAGRSSRPGQHCLLSGPIDETTTNPTTIALDIASSLPAGVKASEGQQVVVPQGTVVLLAAPTSAGQQLNFTSPNAEFYVLKDNVALFGNDITNPQPSTDQTGNPDVTFGFNGAGQNKFQNVTAAIAHRGDLVSGFGADAKPAFRRRAGQQADHRPLDRLQDLPRRDHRRRGADITGGFTPAVRF